MLDVEDCWRELVLPWLIENTPKNSHLRNHWGANYCLGKFIRAVREDIASLPLTHGLISHCSTKIDYYFLAVEDPEYQRWVSICRIDYKHIKSNDSAILVLRKTDYNLGYLNRETLDFSPFGGTSHFTWAEGSMTNTPIRVIDKSQSYISRAIEKAQKIYQQHLWNSDSDNDHFAQDMITSASELMPHYGSRAMFLAHLPSHAVVPEWIENLDEDEIPQPRVELGTHMPKPCRIYLDDIQNFQMTRDVDSNSLDDFLDLNGYLDIPEEKIQNALEKILCERFHKKDWGGEYNDLYTSNVVFSGARRATAFLLKGNGLKVKVMEIKHCGKNGDQLVRLFESPAELFVIQFVGSIAESIIKDVEGKVERLRARGQEAYYCIINGYDTARLLYAYDLLHM